MSRSAKAALGLCAMRIGYAIALLLAPGRVSRRWLGADGDRPGGRVALGGLGARDALIHVGAACAVLRGTPARPWLAASVAGDLADIGATLARAGDLPAGAGPATAVVAGASAVLTVAVAAAMDT